MKKSISHLRLGAFTTLFFLLFCQVLIAQNSVRQIFPRNQSYEEKMLKALGAGLTILPGTDLGRALGSLGLTAAEINYSTDNTINADQAISNITYGTSLRASINGILCALVMNELRKPATTSQAIALKQWSTDLFRSMKIRTANSILLEYQKWRADFCEYKADGYKAPPDCALGSLNKAEWYGGKTPPQDIISKAGMKTVLGNNAGQIASIIAIGAATITAGTAALALASVTGFLSAYSGGMLGITTVTWVSLTAAFGGAAGAELASTSSLTALVTGTEYAASGAIGSAGWASVVAAPVAAIIMAIVVGTVEGIRVVEDQKVEPMLKMKLGAAMSEHINIANMMADSNARSMFFMAFMEATQKNFQIPVSNVAGEVRFYCQAGYVSTFRLVYDDNVDKTGINPQYKRVEINTKNLTVGNEESLPIPAGAKNIYVGGWYLAGDWKRIFWEKIEAPTFVCYTSYGTIFDARFKTDCPEVGRMISKPNELTVTQGGGYVAWVTLTYTQSGKTVTLRDQQGLGAGWREVYQIPNDATNIHLVVRDATGLVWDPWKTIIDKTWPTPPNECIKVYGTTLNPKWNNECN